MASNDPAQTTPIDDNLTALFQKIEEKFRETKLSDESWYILAIACIVASPDPEASAQLYQHLCAQPAYTTSAARQALVRRLREALVKAVSLVGVCKPIEAIVAIGKVERAEDREHSCTRRDWQCDEANHQRGIEWFRKLYTRNAGDTMGLFDAHRDFAWISAEITYGLYLSDRQVLDDVDTEMVVLPAIMMQNLPSETHWHIRGTRRIGVSKDDTEAVCECVRAVAEHFGVRLNKVPTVDQVEPDV
ncbi:hypothetical protein MGN70_009947 [Eutypa lata]|uniref:Putative carboxymuconolactone decarboxylase protein n=1 Tax=Eutypa lata (strain UCR-EL1) TaxID=1287681 RepID=M7T6X9_EUTLA|nr:putative carboxymuconolactone decarboxylase protein [Eutypa lata UCREL1]KAI1248746.1 hypothetical protein MGN70_009947 [Eutypa lata]